MVTIFTPTYNRREKIKLLKASLDAQTCFDFEWIVVDDGSDDGTEYDFKFIEATANYPIRYYKQENAGKHIAHNKGVEKAEGDLFICVDSDDQLRPDAVAIMNSVYDEKDFFIGYVFPKIGKFGDEEIWEKIDKSAIDIIDTKEIFNIKETAVLIKTSTLKDTKFKQYVKSGGGMKNFVLKEFYIIN